MYFYRLKHFSGCSKVFELCIVSARTTSFQLAVFALKDEPMRSRTTHSAVPEEQGRLALDDLEAVVTVTGNSHLAELIAGLNFVDLWC